MNDFNNKIDRILKTSNQAFIIKFMYKKYYWVVNWVVNWVVFILCKSYNYHIIGTKACS